jgi:hypothetical protein
MRTAPIVEAIAPQCVREGVDADQLASSGEEQPEHHPLLRPAQADGAARTVDPQRAEHAEPRAAVARGVIDRGAVDHHDRQRRHPQTIDSSVVTLVVRFICRSDVCAVADLLQGNDSPTDTAVATVLQHRRPRWCCRLQAESVHPPPETRR